MRCFARGSAGLRVGRVCEDVEIRHCLLGEGLGLAFGSDLSGGIRNVRIHDVEFVGTDYGMPLVHAEADFESPVRYGDRLRIELTVERVGKKSLTFAYQVFGADGRLSARCKLVHAIIDRKTFESRPVPPELIEGLKRLKLVG